MKDCKVREKDGYSTLQKVVMVLRDVRMGASGGVAPPQFPNSQES